VCGKEWLNKLFREQDKESGIAVSRDGFKIIVTTNLSPAEISSKLSSSLPLSKCMILEVKE